MKPSEGAAQIRSPGSRGGTSALQEYFLSRLQRLVALKEQQLQATPQDKLSLRLLARALYATYMDCVSTGAGDQAGALLEKAQSQAHGRQESKASNN